MVHFCRRQDLFHAHNILEDGNRPALSPAGPRRTSGSGPRWAGGATAHFRSVGRVSQGNLPKIDHVVNGGVAMFEELHGEVVVVPGLAIDPIIGGDHVVGIERSDDVIHHIFLCQAQLTGVYAVYIEPQSRVVHVLRNIDLADAVHLAKASGQVLRDAINLV